MSFIYEDPSLAKIVIMCLIGMVAVLIIAVIYLGIKKNQIIYVEKEVPASPAAPQKISPLSVDTTKNDATKVIPAVSASPASANEFDFVEIDDAKDDELDLMSIGTNPAEANEETQEAELIMESTGTTVIPPFHASQPSPTQTLKGVDVTIVVQGKTTTTKINHFPCMLGRDAGKCDVIISEPAVSRRHAKLVMEDGVIYLEDVSEHNGTYLNETKLPPLGKARVHAGDEIALGRARIKVERYIYE